MTTLSVSTIAQGTEMSSWEELEFFSKLTVTMNKAFKTWGKSLQVPYVYEPKF